MNVEADISGSVITVHVAVGDFVTAGKVLVTIESMKMEVPIEAATDGVVTEVHARAGELVDEGDVVVVLT